MSDIWDIVDAAIASREYFSSDRIVCEKLDAAIEALEAAGHVIDERYPLELDSNGPRQLDLFAKETNQ